MLEWEETGKTIKAHSTFYFSAFQPFQLLENSAFERFSFFSKSFPIHSHGEIFNFGSASTSSNIQLDKLFSYQNLQLFMPFQPITI